MKIAWHVVLAASMRTRILWRLLAVVTAIGLLAPLSANAEQPVRLGILAFRPKPDMLARWQPLTDYLNRAVPGHRFETTVFHYDELETAIARRQVDFVLTQPAHYVLMTYRNGLSSPLATLVEKEAGHALATFGGVIFTRAGRADIATLADIKGKVLATSSTSSLGSYQMQAYELAQAGIQLPQNARVIETGQPQDLAVQMVLEGKADVGFVRTGVIETMEREGKLDASALKIVNRRTVANFPYRLSTRVYPEWAFAAMPDVEEDLSRQVAAVLLSLPHDGEVARLIGIHGFNIPADYHPVEDLLREMRLPPFDVAPRFTLRDIWNRYSDAVAVTTLSVSLLLLMLAARLAWSNSNLKQRSSQLKLSMARLADSEASQHTILDNLGEGVYGVDTVGRCMFVNATALFTLGYGEDDVLGADEHALFHHHRADGQPYPRAECPILRTIQDGEPRRLEEWFFRKDGTGFPVGLTVTPLSQDGQAVGAVVVFRDISEFKAAEAQLRKLSLAVEQSPVIIIITDLGGNIEYVNEAFVRNTGFGRDEVVGQNPRILQTGKTPPETYASLWDTLASGQSWKGEFYNQRKNGSDFFQDAVITPIRDPDGRISHYLAVAQDVTERKQNEARLVRFAEQVGRYAEEVEDLYQRAPCGYHSLGNQGELRRINDTELGWLGYSREEMIGKLNLSDILTPDSLAKFQHGFSISRETGTACELELDMIRKEGTLLPVLVSATPVFDDDEHIITSRATVFDMTERKRMDQERSDYLTRLEEKSRHIVAVQEASRRRLAAELHDRTSPNLAAIGINMSHIASAFAENPSPGFAERIEDTRALIEDTAVSIREICADMRPPVLDYAGLPAALEAYSQQFSRRTGIAVQVDCAHHYTRLPRNLESVLFRVFQEALTNCAKHAHATSITVELSDGGFPLRLTVRDDGVGFDPELLWSGESPACGLGILNMREMVEFVGGNFTIESSPGQGTRISVEMLDFDS